MPAQGSRVKHDELAVVARSALALKDLRIRKIQDRRTLVGMGRTPGKLLKPDIVGEHHMIGKICAQFLDQQQDLKGERAMADLEFTSVELGKNVVDVEDDPGAHKLRNEGGEH